MSLRRNLAPSEAPLVKQLNDAEYSTIAELYQGADPRFKKWVSDNIHNNDRMEQMEQILKTNAHTKRSESNFNYTAKYIDAGLFNQIDFHGGSRRHRKRSHRKRSHRKRSHRKRSHRKRSHRHRKRSHMNKKSHRH